MQKLDEEFLANGGEWKLFNLKKLFGAATRGKRLKSADRIEGELPFVTAGETDMGISAFVGNSIEVFDSNTITIDMFGSAKYRSYEYGADDHVAVVHTQNIDKNAVLFIASAIHKVSNAGQFSYSRNFYARDADELNILLPALNEAPNYEYMAKYMNLVHKERITALKNYIAKNNLNDFILTDEEKIDIGGGRDWQAFRIGDLFNCIAQGARLTKQDQIKGDLPFVMSGITETGVVAKIGNSKNEFPSNSLTIDIFGNVFYRSFRFGASDDVGVYWNDDKQIDKLAMLFIGCSIQTALTGQFSYGYKLRSSKSSDLTCFLPVKNNEPDYEYMATFIKAIQKQVIKPVVEFTQKQLAEN